MEKESLSADTKNKTNNTKKETWNAQKQLNEIDKLV